MICPYPPWPQENMQVSAHLLTHRGEHCGAAYLLAIILFLLLNRDLLTED